MEAHQRFFGLPYENPCPQISVRKKNATKNPYYIDIRLVGFLRDPCNVEFFIRKQSSTEITQGPKQFFVLIIWLLKVWALKMAPHTLRIPLFHFLSTGTLERSLPKYSIKPESKKTKKPCPKIRANCNSSKSTRVLGAERVTQGHQYFHCHQIRKKFRKVHGFCFFSRSSLDSSSFPTRNRKKEPQEILHKSSKQLRPSL